MNFSPCRLDMPCKQSPSTSSSTVRFSTWLYFEVCLFNIIEVFYMFWLKLSAVKTLLETHNNVFIFQPSATLYYHFSPFLFPFHCKNHKVQPYFSLFCQRRGHSHLVWITFIGIVTAQTRTGAQRSWRFQPSGKANTRLIKVAQPAGLALDQSTQSWTLRANCF